MASDISIKLNIDAQDTDVKKSLAGVQKALEQISHSLDNLKIDESLNKNFAQTNTNLEKLNDTISETTDNTSVLEKTLLGLGGLASFVGITSAANNFKKTAEEATFSSHALLSIVKLFSKGISDVPGGLNKAANAAQEFNAASVIADKTLVGLSARSQALGLALFGIGSALKDSENQLVSWIGVLSIAASVLLDNFGLAIQKVLIIVGKFAYRIGSELIHTVESSIDAFIEFEQETFNFNRIIQAFDDEFNGSTGTLTEWNAVIEKVRDTTGQTRGALRSAVTEIVSATGQIGLNADQMENLLKVSTDYNSLVHGNLQDTVINFISALNGNSQSVIKYGVHLGESAVASKTFGENSEAQFRSLSDGEKVQARFNALLKQYQIIAGNAAAQTNVTAGVIERYNNNIKQLSISYGAGANIIESIALRTRAFNAILESLSPTIVEITGFLAALIGRTLQVVGVFLQLVFTISVVTSVIKALNFLLATDSAAALFNTNIIFINKSLSELIVLAGATNVELTSLSGVIKTFGQISVIQFGKLSELILGANIVTEGFSKTMLVFGGRVLYAVAAGLASVGNALVALATNPIFLAIAGLVVLFYALKKAFEVIEERTGALSTLFEGFKAILSATSPIFDAISDAVSAVFNFIKKLADKGFGLLIVTIAALIDSVLDLGRSFNVFPKKVEAQILESSKKLKILISDLDDVGFQVSKLAPLGEKAARGIASIPKEASDATKEIIKSLEQLEKSLKKAGLNTLQIIELEKKERIAALKEAYDANLVTAERSAQLRHLIEVDYLTKTKKAALEIAKKQREEIEKEQKRQAEITTNLSSGDPIAILKGIKEKAKNAIGESIEVSFNGGDVAALTAGFLGKIGQGAQGAVELFSKGLGAIADSFIPGIGGAVAGVVQFLSQSPDQMKASLQAFFDALPNILINIFTNIGNLVIGLVNGLTSILDRLPDVVGSLLDGLINLVETLPDALSNLVAKIPEIVQRFIGALVEKAPDLITKGLIPQSPKLIASLATAGIEIAKNFIKNAPKIAAALVVGFINEVAKAFVGFINGIIDLLNGINILGFKPFSFTKLADPVALPVPEFASGGEVPPGFNNDNFVAKLTSGESVVPSELNQRMIEFLDAQDRKEQATNIAPQPTQAAPQAITVNLQFGQTTLAQAILDLDRQGYRLRAS